jgi:hypothetical protein
MRSYVICDSSGTVIGTAPIGVEEVRTSLPGAPLSKGETEGEVFQVRVVPEPLPGQTVYEVELPTELARLEDGAEFQKAISEYRLAPREAMLVRGSLENRETGA